LLHVEDYLWSREDLPYTNFAQWLDAIDRRFSDRIAMRRRNSRGKDFETWTYGRLAAESRRIARTLLAAGLKAGDRVLLWSENSFEWCSVWIGSAIAGLVVVPVDALIGEDEVGNIVAQSGAKALFLSAKKVSSFSLLASRAAGAEEGGRFAVAAIIGELQGADSPALSWKELDGIADLPAPSSIAPDAPASIIFTSGTTGISKGVTLSHRGIIANANASILSLPITKEDIFVCVLPLHHTYPTTCCFIAPLCEGSSITMVDRIVGKVIVDDVRDSKSSFLIAVPLLLDKLRGAIDQNFRDRGPLVYTLLGTLMALTLALSKRGFPALARATFRGIREKTGLATLRLIVSGGGPLNPSTADFFEALGWGIVQGYGMSENGPLITVNLPRLKDNASAGLAVKHTEIRIVDENREGIGEIAVKSPSLMLGYFNNREATAEVFDQDGFLLTGDLGYLDQRGFLFITGRKKSLIVTGGGKNIYPEEIETKFDGSRIIKEVLVVGRKGKNVAAEDVVAVCVPDIDTITADRGGQSPSSDAVRDLVKAEIESANRHLPPYKKIADFIIRDEEFEKTSSKKIKRFLYQDYAAPQK